MKVVAGGKRVRKVCKRVIGNFWTSGAYKTTVYYVLRESTQVLHTRRISSSLSSSSRKKLKYWNGTSICPKLYGSGSVIEKKKLWRLLKFDTFQNVHVGINFDLTITTLFPVFFEGFAATRKSIFVNLPRDLEGNLLPRVLAWCVFSCSEWVTLSLTCFGVSVMKIAEVSLLELIFVLLPIQEHG